MMSKVPSQRWPLDNAELKHAESPETFEIPSREERISLIPGDVVKLIFLLTDEGSLVERIWVNILDAHAGQYAGNLTERSVSSNALRAGQRVEFGPEHVCSIYVLSTNPQHPQFRQPLALPSRADEPIYCGLPLHYWLRILQGKDDQARIKALNMLRCMGTEAEEAIPTLLELLKEETIKISVPAAQLLSQIGLAASSALLEMLTSSHVSARWGAVYALGEIGLAEFAPRLKDRLQDENAEVREVANKTLAKLAESPGSP